MKTKTLAVALGLAAMALTGCVGGADYTAQLTEPGVWWELVALNGEPPEYTYIRATFSSSGHFMSHMSCNDCWGPYIADGNRLRFEPLAMTLVACYDSMEEEGAYDLALREVVRYAIDDGRLVMFNSEGDAILVFERREGPVP